jgi:hypothetical protein
MNHGPTQGLGPSWTSDRGRLRTSQELPCVAVAGNRSSPCYLGKEGELVVDLTMCEDGWKSVGMGLVVKGERGGEWSSTGVCFRAEKEEKEVENKHDG